MTKCHCFSQNSVGVASSKPVSNDWNTTRDEDTDVGLSHTS